MDRRGGAPALPGSLRIVLGSPILQAPLRLGLAHAACPLRKRNPTAVPRSYTYYSLLKLKGASLQHLLTAHLYTDFLNFLIKFSVGDDKDVDSALRVPGLGEVLKLD